ncbi:NAD(P)-dependent oxidoreductase [Phyllobacterium sp. 0TCS1.6C]|uniref:NAD-dependent epimerase/dehydratase family protein n=1 Tax=unclassified Phyllobacterium TaxID=2638441 RepID=UPI00226438AC|nr:MULTISPECIES: NAD(P)-dependent oxidoreductase [unclassified Phyllobacterium]MCX8279214.1 NAD(P)-dependent oxidoreductase [Phyllobacterium sp. 0TCS1.6C]MCX8293998.1 NAD(P)-dependent oxidoreductase [Phyllobacterium sp. 0TCS1.6A]
MSCTLVTGSSGFIGSAICEALNARGVPVVGFDRIPPAFPDAEWAQKMTFVAGEIGDASALAELFADYPITHVVHAAAMTPDEDFERAAPDTIMDVNITGACRVMAAARRSRPLRIVALSSISVYGNAFCNGEGRLDEYLSLPAPETLYGISKWAAEQAMRRYARLEQMDLRIVRLGPVFGPWEHQSGSRTILSPHHQIAAFARSGELCILPRAAPANWIYSRQAARRIVDLLSAQQPAADVFNLGGGQITTLVDWCEELTLKIPGFRWHVDAGATNIRYGYVTDRPALDNRRIDTLSAPDAILLTRAVEDYLGWLDRFSPLTQFERK